MGRIKLFKFESCREIRLFGYGRIRNTQQVSLMMGRASLITQPYDVKPKRLTEVEPLAEEETCSEAPRPAYQTAYEGGENAGRY